MTLPEDDIRRHCPPVLLLVLMAALAAVSHGEEAPAAPCLEPLATYDLSDPSATTFDLRTARDLRWLNDGSFALAAFPGVYQHKLQQDDGRDSKSEVKLLVERGDSLHQLPFTFYLGTSEGDLAIGSPAWVMGWKNKVTSNRQPGVDGTVLMEATHDLDLHRGKLAVLGVIRDASGEAVAPEGVILRTGPLGTPIEQFQKIQYSINHDIKNKTDSPTVRCGLMEMTSIRFLQDGSLLAIPGFEPDVFHYAPNGRLLRIWSNDDIGFDGDCPVPDDKVSYYSMNELARFEWVNQRRVVDEIFRCREEMQGSWCAQSRKGTLLGNSRFWASATALRGSAIAHSPLIHNHHSSD